MNLKVRLQRMLQILEESERVGALSDLERDILLNELREAYSEIKFSATENEEQKQEQKVKTSTSPIAPTIPNEEEQTEEEPEVEVELLFEEETEETENGERKAENGEQEQEQSVETPTAPTTPIIEEPSVERDENLSTPNSPLSTHKRSPLLSLYEDAPAPVVGERFHEQPSVADTIACPKGVAESAPVTSLRDSIGVADKFMLIRELFDGDTEAYGEAIDALDRQLSFDDCIIYISENFTWRPQSEATKTIMSLLQRKFNE